MRNCMSKATIASASSLSPPKTKSGSVEATTVDLSADNMQDVPATWLVRRRRSLRSRRVIHKTSIPLVQPEVVMDTEEIQVKVKLNSNETLKFKVRVEDEPQQVLDPKVKKLRITVSRSKTIRMLVPLDRLLILADVCCEKLLASPRVSSPSDKS